MRETLTSLILTSQNYEVDASTTSSTALSDTKTFNKKEINNVCRLIYDKFKNYKVQKQQTASTVASQQYYHLPPDFLRLEAATVTVGSVAYPLQVVDSPESWKDLNQVDFSGNVFPQFIFPRRDDFGIWPIPTSVNTITLDYNYMLKDLVNEDYTTGTVAVTNNSATITGTDTTRTDNMVGRWFRATDDGDWYRLATFTSTTSMALESVFEGSTDTSSNYVIGDSPEIPSETHQYIPWAVAAAYLAGPKREVVKAQTYQNYFFTGDFSNTSRRLKDAGGGILGVLKDYMSRGRSNSQLVRRNQKIGSRFDERWSTTLS